MWYKNTKKVNKEEYLKHKRQLGDNTILLSINGTIGNLAFFNNEKIVLGKSACYINIDEEKTNKYFINDILKTSTVQNFFYSEVTGSTIKNLSLSTIKNTKLSLPSKPEQEKIASFLSSVDSKIEQLSKKRTLLEQYKKGVMQKIFSQELRFQEDDGSAFPEWVEKKLGEVANVYQPQTISQTDLKEDGYDVYGANGIIGKYDKFNHEFEQIAVTCRGNTCGTVNYTREKSWITGNAMVINLDGSSSISKKYLYFLLSNTNLTYLITGSGQPQITGDIKNHRVLIPSLKEQTKIATFLSSLDKKIELTDKEFNATKEFKKGLLQKMFV